MYSACPELLKVEEVIAEFPDIILNVKDFEVKRQIAEESAFKMFDKYQMALDMVDNLPIYFEGYKYKTHAEYMKKVTNEFEDKQMELVYLVEAHLGSPLKTPVEHTNEVLVEVTEDTIENEYLQYEQHIVQCKETTYYTVDMQDVMNKEKEKEYEAMDVLAMAHHYNYEVVVIVNKESPNTTSLMCDYLNNSGVTARDFSQWKSINKECTDYVKTKVLFWMSFRGREAWDELYELYGYDGYSYASYVKLKQMSTVFGYLPSLLYGRGVGIDHQGYYTNALLRDIQSIN